ncbi:hypothetical protein DSO57_1004882 [Entomophthora muscae]|uniref:Uncharacterized protein n=1 Tax=Entomophthora muscae TaxID=34485 RepID=A0ACC2TVQ9_9FUNG|nr:hypothetical protein DSO57_1004882 [Entomophthora muscae]
MTKSTRQEVVSMQAPLAFKASIVGFEKLDNHVWFTVSVSSNEPGLPSKHYQIARTFRQFVHFSQQLKQQAETKIPALRPAKHFFTIPLMSCQQKFEELERYLAQYSRLPKELAAAPLSRTFFGIRESDLHFNNARLSTDDIPETPALVRSTSDSTVATQSSDDTPALPPPPVGMKRSRSLSVRPFLDNARTALVRSRSVMQPLTRSLSNKSLEENVPVAPWNLSALPPAEEIPLDAKIPKSVIAPWNIKNLDTADQAIIEQLKPVLSKRKSSMQLGERGSRMRDFENCMDSTLPADYIKVKVMLNSTQIIMLRVLRSIKFDQLIIKIKAKFLKNSQSSISNIQNKLLVYKLSSSKIYQLTNSHQFDELMALKPESITLCWIDVDRKFITR